MVRGCLCNDIRRDGLILRGWDSYAPCKSEEATDEGKEGEFHHVF